MSSLQQTSPAESTSSLQQTPSTESTSSYSLEPEKKKSRINKKSRIKKKSLLDEDNGFQKCVNDTVVKSFGAENDEYYILNVNAHQKSRKEVIEYIYNYLGSSTRPTIIYLCGTACEIDDETFAVGCKGFKENEETFINLLDRTVPIDTIRGMLLNLSKKDVLLVLNCLFKGDIMKIYEPKSDKDTKLLVLWFQDTKKGGSDSSDGLMDKKQQDNLITKNAKKFQTQFNKKKGNAEWKAILTPI